MSNPTVDRSDMPPLFVSSSGSDDMGEVLDNLGLEYTDLSSVSIRNHDDGVVMLNCDGGWEGEVDILDLTRFVEQGGAVIASDHASSYVEEVSDATFSTKLLPTSITATVADDELRELLGEGSVDLTFNMPLWHKPGTIPNNATPLLTAEGGLLQGQSVLAYKFQRDEGEIIYTAFHNHAQVSEIEEALLQLLMMVPIAESTGTTLKEAYTTITGESLGGGAVIESTGIGGETGHSTNTVQFITENGGMIERDLEQGEELALGRSDFEPVVPGDQHRYISRTHLEIRATQTGAIQLRDADSSNGTSLNGQDISEGEYWTLSDETPVELANGSVSVTVSLD